MGLIFRLLPVGGQVRVISITTAVKICSPRISISSHRGERRGFLACDKLKSLEADGCSNISSRQRERVCPLGVGGKREGGDCAGRHKMVAMGGDDV